MRAHDFVFLVFGHVGIDRVDSEIDVFVGGEPGEEGIALKYYHAIGTRFANLFAVESHFAGGWLGEATDHIQQCTFTAAGVTDDANEFAFLNGEVDFIEDGVFACGGGENFGCSIEDEEICGCHNFLFVGFGLVILD